MAAAESDSRNHLAGESADADNTARRQTHTFYLRRVDSVDEKQAPSRGVDRVLSVRIPVSTLLELDASSELLLDASSFNESEPSSGVLRKKGYFDSDDGEEKLTVYPNACLTNVYQKSSTNPSELAHVGHSSRQLTIKTMSKELEDLGRKARERLEEEQSKRKEIVVLEQEPEQVKTSKRKGASFAEAIRKQRPRPTSKRKHVEHFSDSFAGPPSGTVDTWTPDVSHVSQCTKGERSSVVRLHGLPVSVKPESIRKFFSGLNVERIFVVLSNRSCIPEWDERDHPSSQLLVQRHDPSFRVYVKFVSSPVTDLALARSEEFLYVNTNQDEKIGVHVGITKLSKSVAGYLQRNMAIDGVNGRPLHETLDKEESRLGDRVRSFLWTMALRDLDLSSSMQAAALQQSDFPWQIDPSKLNPSVFVDYQKLARHYNSLVDECDENERARRSMGWEEWDPRHSMDAVVRIRRAASDRLLDEIENVKLMLYRARAERRRSIHNSSDRDD